MEPLTNRLIHGEGAGRTEIRLDGGGEPILVMEPHEDVWNRVMEGEWMVLQLDDKKSLVHIRTSTVAALIDLNSHEHE